MRLLPVRPDHAGRRAAGEQHEADARADRRPHGRQHLPLRHLSAHRPRHPARREGGLSHDRAHHERHRRSRRRGFIKGAAGLTFAFALGGASSAASEALAADARQAQRLGDIGTDNTITILCPPPRWAGRAHGAAAHPRRGARRRLVEGEDRVRAGQSQGLRQSARAVQRRADHAASVSVPGYFMPLRMAGAQARKVLLDNAARQWNVPVDELSTEPAWSSTRSPKRTHLATASRPSSPKLPGRAAEDRRRDLEAVAVPLIGEGHRPRRRPSRPTARRIRHRRAGAGHGLRVGAGSADGGRQGRDRQHGRGRQGQRRDEDLPLPFGVAVIGETVEATSAARNALKVKWDTSGAAAPTDSVKARRNTPARARPGRQAVDEYKVGERQGAERRRQGRWKPTYWSEYCYHAQMEPMNAVAKVGEDGQSAEIWTGTQFGALAAAIISGVLKTTPDKIKGPPAAAGRRLRPAHLAGCRGPGDRAVQHHQEAGEADPHPRG